MSLHNFLPEVLKVHTNQNFLCLIKKTGLQFCGVLFANQDYPVSDGGKPNRKCKNQKNDGTREGIV